MWRHICTFGVFDTNCLDISTSKDKSGRNALHHILAHSPDIEGVRLLLSKGVDIKGRDIDGNYLTNSHFYIDHEICLLSPRNGSDKLVINNQGLTRAHLSANCLRLDAPVLEALMDFGMDMEVPDTEGRALLHHIALKGSLTETVLKFLLDKTRLRPDDRDSSGKIPLQYAAEQAGKEHHRYVFDSKRRSRSLEILMRNEAVTE